MIFETKPSTELPWDERVRREEKEHEGKAISVLWM
jgi:hypothetical protein